MDPNRCLSRLGEILGIDITLDDQQQALLMIDNSLFISLHFAQNQWTIYGMVSQLTEEEINHLPAQYWKTLMKLNLEWAENGQGSLCLFEDTKALVYIDALPAAIANGDDLYQYLDNFTQRLEHAISWLKPSPP